MSVGWVAVRDTPGPSRVPRVHRSPANRAPHPAAPPPAAPGPPRVAPLARRTAFGPAVAEAARVAGAVPPEQLPYLQRRQAWDPVTRTWDDTAYDEPEQPAGEPVQWLWLLH